MALDYVTYCTAEGDRIILELQCARYLVKAADVVISVGGSSLPPSHPCHYLSTFAGGSCSSVDTLEQVMDVHNLLQLFQFRAARSVTKVAQRLRQLQAPVDAGGAAMSPEAAWATCAIDLVEASRHHCHFTILKYGLFVVGR